MFVRGKKNKSGTISVQIIDKSSGSYRVIKTVGSSSDPDEIAYLRKKAYTIIPTLIGQTSIDFWSDSTKEFVRNLKQVKTSQVQVEGPEKVFGKIFDDIGFGAIEQDLFRHLVITRLIAPGSKLKTVDYLKRYKGISIDISKVYRFMDTLHRSLKRQVEQIAFDYTKSVLAGKISVVFYDMTTLYFESSDEDDLRITGFSKDGKAQNPQILLGLLVASNGYPIGYEIFEGNKYEGHTLIPVLEHFQQRFNLSRPIVIADAGLLSTPNIKYLRSKQYEFILGARLKNESDEIKDQILSQPLADGEFTVIKIADDLRLVVSYSEKRAKNDLKNRERGLKRLERSLNKGKLTKSHINNRGYNKYLRLEGDISITIDYDKFNSDNKWDGLKGYLTNTKLSAKDIIENYNQLWQIEKAFRISKTDLKIRPIYHRIRSRIEAHICIAFVAYTIYKEVEKRLADRNIPLSPARVAELTKTMYTIKIRIPETDQWEIIPFEWTQEQKLVGRIL
ncbi:MAG TPA: IS1634 family transposase [Candidatus Cloacimonas sp.]|jgi:transposase|nr:IS1634 family transposase [Candidatus Cloacimonas sp.]